MEKARKYLKNKYESLKRFGDARAGKESCYWYINDKREKNYFLADNRGLYVGNDLGILKSSLKSREIKNVDADIPLLKKMINNIFFLTYVSKDSFINSLMKMQAQSNKELGGAVSSIGDIYITGEKDESLLTIDLDVEIIKRNSKLKTACSKKRCL